MGKLLGQEPHALFADAYGLGRLLARQQTHLPLGGGEHAAVGERLHAGVLGAGEYVRVAELDGVEGVLAEQLHAEAGIAVQLALLFVVEGVQFLIDDLQGGAHGHGPAVAL